MTESSTNSLFVACQTKICHTFRTFRLTHAACKCIEALFALRVPHETPFLTTVALLERTSTTTITLWLVAESKEIGIALWTVLVAHWPDSSVAIWTLGVTESKDLVFIILTGVKCVPHTTTVCLFPA